MKGKEVKNALAMQCNIKKYFEFATSASSKMIY